MPKEWNEPVIGDRLPAPDLAEVRRALAVLADPGQGVELRGLPSGRSRVHPGSDLDGLCRSAAELADGTGVYWTLNPSRHKEGTRATRTRDVLRRRWLLLDIDRKKTAADKHLSATDAEKEEARKLAGTVIGWLSDEGWPAPVLVDSGNGWHPLYRIDLPAGEASQELIRSLLHHLAVRFDTDGAEIDVAVHDAPRISKLPGTWARKGPNTADRPWRMARLVRVPDPLEVVPESQLRSTLAALAAGPPEEEQAEPARPKAWDVSYGEDGPAAYGRRALEGECAILAATPHGEINTQLNKSSFRMGRLIDTGCLDEETAFRELLAAAREAGADNPAKDEACIRRALAKGRESTRTDVPEAPAPRPHAGANGKAKKEPATPENRAPPAPVIFPLRQLLAMDLPPASWAIPGLLSEGVTILAGKPKLGKSWFALNLALTLAGGGKALGAKDTTPGDVLYLSLEDRLRRVKDRAGKVLKGLGVEAPERLDVAVEWQRQDRGGLDQLAKWMESKDRPALVIVDVWAKFRPQSKSSRSAYDQDYEHLSQFKALIDHYKSSALLVLHCKKAKGDDVLDEISGTLGQAGSTDGALVLTRARSEREAELFVTGRDVEEETMALEFDPQGFTWKLLGKAEERTESKIKAAVIAMFKNNTGQVIGTTEIANTINLPAERVHYLRTILYRMVDANQLERAGPGRFRWPVRSPDEYDPELS